MRQSKLVHSTLITLKPPKAPPHPRSEKKQTNKQTTNQTNTFSVSAGKHFSGSEKITALLCFNILGTQASSNYSGTYYSIISKDCFIIY